MSWRRVLVSALVVLGACGEKDSVSLRNDVTPRSCVASASLRLAYTGSAGEEGGDVYGIRADGSAHQLTTDGGSYSPSFSPDGSRIVFSSIGETGSVSDTTGPEGLDLHLIDADGSNRRRLTAGGTDRSPHWSPDGRRIVFSRQVGGNPNGVPRRLFTMDAEGGTEEQFVHHDGPERDDDPRWSPDGRQVAFVRSSDGGAPASSQLMVANVDGTGVRTIITDLDLADPAWAPDGRSIAYTSIDRNLGDRGESVELVQVDDGATEVVAAPAAAPSWSFDGRRLYFYARGPAASDFSGDWRITEYEVGEGSTGEGVAIPGAPNVSYLYGDFRVAAPPCGDGSDERLTSDSDAADTERVTDPVTGDAVLVMPRAQAVDEALDHWILGGAEVERTESKLVHQNALDGLDPPIFEDVRGEGLVWLVGFVFTTDSTPSFAALEAETGDFLGSSGVLGPWPASWDTLDDLAPP